MGYVNIELYDGNWLFDDDVTWSKEAILLYDGEHPFWMLGLKLEQMVKHAEVAWSPLNPWLDWRSKYVGAFLIKWSTEDAAFAGFNRVVPLQPSLELHRSADSLWRLFLGPDAGMYNLQCYRIRQQG